MNLAHMILKTGIEVILAGLGSALAAQFIKVISYIVRNGRFNFKLLVQSGGMPSSHSSTMSAMAASVGIVAGFTSVSFAIALGVAIVVMYDAAGVRQAAGKMAGILNRMTEDFYRHQPERIPIRLRELLGHTPFEVFIGALFGISFSVALHEILRFFN